MVPGLSLEHETNGVEMNTKLRGKVFRYSRNGHIGMGLGKSTNGHNDGVSQLGTPNLLASSVRMVLPMLGNHILRVVLWRSKKKMIGPNASRVVAVMAYEHAMRN